MRKILLLLILLLNLQIATKQDGISIEVGRVAAQLPYDETLANVTVTGSMFTECPQCGENVYKKDLEYHKEYTCRERQEICTRCGRLYKPANGVCSCYSNIGSDQYGFNGQIFCMRCNKAVDECICDEYVVIGNREYNIGALLNLFEIGVKVNGVYGFGGKIFCAWCNRPIDLCICGGCVVTGSNQSSDQLVASGTWTVGGNGNGDSGGGDTPTPIPQPDNQWVPGNYLHPDECQTFFKDSLMIMPQTKTYTDCVSASITNCIMWQNNFPLEKYDSIKLAIEDNYELLYHRPLKEDGVRGFILDEFILGYSGVSVKAIPTSGFRTYINDGYPIGVVIAKINKEKKQIYAHFISIIGYDECENLYLCYDSEEKKLIKHDLATLQATGFLYQIIK